MYLYFVVFDKSWVIGGWPLSSSVSFAACIINWTTSLWSGVRWRTFLPETFPWRACNPFSSIKGSLPRFSPIYRKPFSQNWQYFLYQAENAVFTIWCLAQNALLLKPLGSNSCHSLLVNKQLACSFRIASEVEKSGPANVFSYQEFLQDSKKWEAHIVFKDYISFKNQLKNGSLWSEK